MFKRFTISMPEDFIESPEKVFRVLKMKSNIEDALNPNSLDETLQGVEEESAAATESEASEISSGGLGFYVESGELANSLTISVDTDDISPSLLLSDLTLSDISLDSTSDWILMEA